MQETSIPYLILPSFRRAGCEESEAQLNTDSLRTLVAACPPLARLPSPSYFCLPSDARQNTTTPSFRSASVFLLSGAWDCMSSQGSVPILMSPPSRPNMNPFNDVEMADNNPSRSPPGSGGGGGGSGGSGGASKHTYAKRGKITIVACVPCRRRKTKVTRPAQPLYSPTADGLTVEFVVRWKASDLLAMRRSRRILCLRHDG